MTQSRIESLDLRSSETIEAERIQAAKDAQARTLDRMWDFPAFPAKVDDFIKTGIVPKWSRRTLEVTITFDAVDFQDRMERIKLALEHLAVNTQVKIHDPFNFPTVQGGSLLWKPWTRWNLPDNWPIYCLAAGLSILIGLIVGTHS